MFAAPLPRITGEGTLAATRLLDWRTIYDCESYGQVVGFGRDYPVFCWPLASVLFRLKGQDHDSNFVLAVNAGWLLVGATIVSIIALVKHDKIEQERNR